MIDTAGWLIDADRVQSPNRGVRPVGSAISLIIIHNISLPPGRFGGPYIKQLFANSLDPSACPEFAALANLQVSAHLLIDRAGVVTQFVSFAERAWHAGESCFEESANCNDYAIGIELEGTDTTPYTRSQYAVLARVVRELMEKYPQITRARVVGHADVAPGRKSDPGPAFDWPHFFSLIERENEA